MARHENLVFAITLLSLVPALLACAMEIAVRKSTDFPTSVVVGLIGEAVFYNVGWFVPFVISAAVMCRGGYVWVVQVYGGRAPR